LHKSLAAETLAVEVLQVAGTRKEFLKLRGRNGIPIITRREGSILYMNKHKKQCNNIKSSVVQGMQLYKFKKILISNVVISKETILTQGYELPLNAFQLLASVDIIGFCNC
jgi:hypothetical protein